VIPALGVYAFAFYRLLPSAQMIYSNLAKIRFGNPRFKALLNELQSLSPSETQNANRTNEIASIPNTPQLQVNNVSFKYASSNRLILNQINFSVEENQTLGILGKTGSGKTTLLDLMLGLLEPTIGAIYFGGNALNRYKKSEWQRQIGYVPQEIVLLDTSVAKNIAFGIPQNEINMTQVVQASKMAKIHEFVSNELTEGYQTKVGDRGVRLSGGQKQRIGIARALYRKPSVLFFDEATSSLDTITEKNLMDAISSLCGSLTIIIVAHRLNTLKNCDFVIELEKGLLLTVVHSSHSHPIG
jgi:ABC-type bacteriocin/lantibiotic exporter with double-glycine peptidase domain